MRYSMIIKWSDDDQAYLVYLPEWSEGPVSDGASYEEAARRGEAVLETFVEIARQDGKPLPQPQVA